ncbi:MAG: nucleotidyltransferase [Peptococcaceae bacterium]|nr:nucleotidyltransferase [Peptococcaceae bacterium]
MIDILSNQVIQIEDLLNRIGDKLQLNKTRRETIEKSYSTIARLFDNDDGLFKGVAVDIYPQGSYRIGTTVRPIHQNEYDLDFVLQPQMLWREGLNPLEVLKHVQSRIVLSKEYENKTEILKRCVRINYTDYHMDILPAFPERYIQNLSVKVPDKKLKDWKDSCPKGYAKWFELRCLQRKHIALEKMAKIEPLPQEMPYEFKEPLQRAVQIIKRSRDIFFEDKPDFSPISIILTTLAAKYYDGESTAFEAVCNIVEQINCEIQKTVGVMEVYNPINENEKFSEKWDNNNFLYKAFKDFMQYLKEQFINLKNARGIAQVNQILKQLLGETLSEEAINEQAFYVNKSRNNQSLGIVKPAAALTIISPGSFDKESVQPIRKHNFYGV